MFRNLLTFFIFSFSFLATAKTKKKNDEVETRRALPVEEVDVVKFNYQTLAPAENSFVDLSSLPNFKANEDTYENIITGSKKEREFGSATPADAAQFFRVPEYVREERDAAREHSLKNAQVVLLDYLRSTRKELFNDDFEYYLNIVKQNKDFLVEVFFSRDHEKQAELLEKKYKEVPQLKTAIGYFGVFRLSAIHGKLGKIAIESLPNGLEGPIKPQFQSAPDIVLAAQRIEAGFHSFKKNGTKENFSTEDTADYRRYDSRFGIGKTYFSFSPELADKSDGELRRIGLDFLWDLRASLDQELAIKIDSKLEADLAQYVPYDRVYLDAFKRNAFYKGSPEVLVIWKSVGSEKKYRRELVGAGLITTGSLTSNPWQKAGAENDPGNTPDGPWRVFGFNKHYVSKKNAQMWGFTMLSYGNEKMFAGRGFHHVGFYSNLGYCGSHGCFRTSSQNLSNGLSSVIWATINPMQLSSVDHLDFGNRGAWNVYQETQSVREFVRTIRKRVWVTNHSSHEDGYRYTGDATYSQLIRQQYQNYEIKNQISFQKIFEELEDGKKITGTDAKGKSSTRYGKYWIYDNAIREKAFLISF